MSIAVLYTITLIVFLGLDLVGLKYILKPTFQRNIPDLLMDSPRIAPAIIFYAFYVACLVWFVSLPALQGDHSAQWVIGSAALLGAMAYGTYEFTNWATLKGWTGRMVITDVVWGTFLTSLSATAGLVVTEAIS